MPYPARSLRAFISLATLVAPFAHAAAAPERIFSSSFTPALVIEGKAGYPGPLANARVEAHFGSAVATATTAADGTYRVGLELDQIDPGAVVELFARGSGTQSQLVWASPLGPADRLLTLAGNSHRVGFDQDPFVYLSPRSTVAAAAARAFNGWQPVTDAATFWRAVRSRQSATNELVQALALVARGALALPSDVADTFTAVSALAPSQDLYTAYQVLARADACWRAPQSIYCDVSTNLPLDPQMFPPLPWVRGELYSQAIAFRATTYDSFAFQPTDTGATVLTASGATVAATVAPLADGGYELAPRDGGAFVSEDLWVYNGPEWIPALKQATRLYVRLSRGPGGQVEFGWSRDYRYTYPSHPERPDDYSPYLRTVLPTLSASTPLPAVLAGATPLLAGRRWVLPSPLARPQDASVDIGLHGYDVHAFATNTGGAMRSGQPFTFSVVSPAVFTFDSGDRHAEFRFVNEEEPDVWRVRMHVTGPDYENVVDGVLIPADAGALTTATAVGTWRSRNNGDVCSGPYGELGGCSLRFTFHADGRATRNTTTNTNVGSWNLATGPDAGRLLSNWLYPPSSTVYERRGWELVHQAGDHYWVLETYNYDFDDSGDTPPIVFNPTVRLVRYDRQ